MANPLTSETAQSTAKPPETTHNSFQNTVPGQFQNQLPGDFQNQVLQNANIEYPEFQNQVTEQLKNPQNAKLSFNTENNADNAKENNVDEISEDLKEASSLKIRKSYKPYDSSVIGVVSTQPAIVIEGGRIVAMGGTTYQNDSMKPAIALAGRVPVKATAENGPIRKGDLLTSSSKPGYAMKCEVKNLEDGWSYDKAYPVIQENEKCRNSIIGKAMEPLEKGEGKILMFISVQ